MKIIKVKKFFSVQVKAVNEQDFTVDAVVSTKSVDRDGDIIMPEAFRKRLKHYKDHPVLMSDHNYSLLKQIGEATKITLGDEGVEMKFKYYVGAGNQEADWAWVLAQKNMAAYSIGFMAHEWEWITEKDKDTKIERYTGRKFTDIELLEVSQVAVQSNRDGLQTDAHRADIEKELCVAVMKGVDSGDIVLPEPVPAVKPTIAEPEVKDIKDKPHYSEEVLERGTAEGKQTEQPLPGTDDLCKTVTDTIKEAFHNV